MSGIPTARVAKDGVVGIGCDKRVFHLHKHNTSLRPVRECLRLSESPCIPRHIHTHCADSTICEPIQIRNDLNVWPKN